MLGIAADQIYLKGIKTNQIELFRQALKLFPFEKDILIGHAQANLNHHILNRQVKDFIKEALIYDPYSIQFLAMLFQYERALGNENDAAMTLKKLQMVGSNSSLYHKLMKGL